MSHEICLKWLSFRKHTANVSNKTLMEGEYLQHCDMNTVKCRHHPNLIRKIRFTCMKTVCVCLLKE